MTGNRSVFFCVFLFFFYQLELIIRTCYALILLSLRQVRASKVEQRIAYGTPATGNVHCADNKQRAHHHWRQMPLSLSAAHHQSKRRWHITHSQFDRCQLPLPQTSLLLTNSQYLKKNWNNNWQSELLFCTLK